MNETTGSIDWNRFESDYVRLETNVPKQIRLRNWQQGVWFNMPGLQFDVVEEDGQTVRKLLRTTSKRLIRALRPVIMKAIEDNRETVSVVLTRLGEGVNTTYDVTHND